MFVIFIIFPATGAIYPLRIDHSSVGYRRRTRKKFRSDVGEFEVVWCMATGMMNLIKYLDQFISQRAIQFKGEED